MTKFDEKFVEWFLYTKDKEIKFIRVNEESGTIDIFFTDQTYVHLVSENTKIVIN
jgi:hypothetical protein